MLYYLERNEENTKRASNMEWKFLKFFYHRHWGLRSEEEAGEERGEESIESTLILFAENWSLSFFLVLIFHANFSFLLFLSLLKMVREMQILDLKWEAWIACLNCTLEIMNFSFLNSHPHKKFKNSRFLHCIHVKNFAYMAERFSRNSNIKCH